MTWIIGKHWRPLPLHERICLQSLLLFSLHKMRSIWKGFPLNYSVQLAQTVGLEAPEAYETKLMLVSDRPGQPIGSPSASASLLHPPTSSGGGRGRAGRLPERGVCVGVNG